MSRIFLKRSLIESLVGAKLPISDLPGTSVILEDSNENLVLFNEKSGKFFEITDNLPLVVSHLPIKNFFDNYIAPNTILKLNRKENAGLVSYLINFIEIFGDEDDSINVSFWARGNYLRLSEEDSRRNNDKNFWEFTSDHVKEKVLFSFTLFPRIWYIDLPTKEELEIYMDRVNK